MAETTNEKTAKTGKTVSVRLPKGGEREDPNYFIAINGISYLIPKNKSTEVPDFVAAEIERCQGAKDAFDDYRDTHQNKG